MPKFYVIPTDSNFFHQYSEYETLDKALAEAEKEEDGRQIIVKAVAEVEIQTLQPRRRVSYKPLDSRKKRGGETAEDK